MILHVVVRGALHMADRPAQAQVEVRRKHEPGQRQTHRLMEECIVPVGHQRDVLVAGAEQRVHGGHLRVDHLWWVAVNEDELAVGKHLLDIQKIAKVIPRVLEQDGQRVA